MRKHLYLCAGRFSQMRAVCRKRASSFTTTTSPSTCCMTKCGKIHQRGGRLSPVRTDFTEQAVPITTARSPSTRWKCKNAGRFFNTRVHFPSKRTISRTSLVYHDHETSTPFTHKMRVDFPPKRTHFSGVLPGWCSPHHSPPQDHRRRASL